MNRIQALEKLKKTKHELRAACEKILQLEKRIREYKKIESFNVDAIRDLRKSEARYRAVVEDQNEVICRYRPDFTLSFVNDAYCRYYGRKREELIGLNYLSLISDADRKVAMEQNARMTIAHPAVTYEQQVHLTATGEVRWNQWNKQAIFNENNEIVEYQAVGRDITSLKEAEALLESSREDLHRQRAELERKNIALREVLEQIEADKKQIRDDVIQNVEKILLPILQNLKTSIKSFDRGVRYADLLKNNLLNLISPFGRKLSREALCLTPREIEICNMIRSGLRGKEIAEMLCLSYGTVEVHRNRIRKKLGLINQEINLSTYLQSLGACPSNDL